ncbi:MAG: ArsR/SmtB family transcription factor [Halolamina sp.]
MGEEPGEEPIEQILDTIGDEMARRVLIAVSEAPQSAKELAETCEMSLPTVYRRVDVLMDHGLITEKNVVAEDGNHYKEYRCNFDSTLISLGDEKFDVAIYRQDNLPDRFTELWDELGKQ